MNERHQERAQKVVESFRELLEQKALDAISDNEFEQLAIFVQEALADELHDAAEQVEELARKLRAGATQEEVGIGFV